MNIAATRRSQFPGRKQARERGFTLIEVVVSTAIIAITFAAVIFGYVSATDRAEWSAYSLAAQSLAQQGIEQSRAAKWDPEAWPIIDQLGVTNYTQVEILDIANQGKGKPILATNYVSVSTVSTTPQLRQLKADCVWVLESRKKQVRGPFTNTAVTLRAADQ